VPAFSEQTTDVTPNSRRGGCDAISAYPHG